ncbi:FxsA family protein [Actinomadura chokoriensis]|uniref:FxsA family protein n=1 Tax=Actinomadura chokoriensis TaxID=454156 RepID=A0ABV4R087_9ACTN
MLPLLILLGILLLPALEIFVIIQVGGAIGAWPTVGLLVAETVLGAWLVRREGRRAWAALHDTVRTGALHDRELGDAALVMAGGMLLLFPGFVTDFFGLLLVLPFTRPLVRRGLSSFAGRRLRAAEERAATVYPPPGPGFDPFGRSPGRVETPPGPVVRGEVIHEDVVDQDVVKEDDDTSSRA